MRMLLYLYTHLVDGTPEGDGPGLINFPGIVVVKLFPTSTKNHWLTNINQYCPHEDFDQNILKEMQVKVYSLNIRR